MNALRTLRLAPRLLELGVFVALWVAGAVIGLALAPRLVGAASWATRAAAVLVCAVAFNAFVLLMHESFHGVLFRRRGANRWGGVALGATVLISCTAYRVLHTRHHKYLGDARDPDDYANYSSDARVVWLMHWVRLLLGCPIYLVAIPILALRYGTRDEKRDVLVEYALLFALWASVFWLVPLGALLQVWLVPILLVGFMVNVRGFSQHGITDAHDPALASRTLQLPRWVELCVLHENYHLEHHLWPDVPSYHLRRLHELTWRKLPRAVTGRSYSGFLVEFFRKTWRRDDAPIGLVAPATGGDAK